MLTGHLDIVRNPELGRLLAFGARFRATPISVNPIRALEDAVVGENGLQRQIEKEYDPNDGAAMAKIAEWGRCVINICSRLITQCLDQGTEGVKMTCTMQKYMQYLQHHLVLVPADKAANNVIFVCKHWYRHLLYQEISNGIAYAESDKPMEDVVAVHEKVLKQYCLFNSPRIGYLYLTPKMHKNPPGARFILGSSVTTLTSCSKILSDVLNFILMQLASKDNRLIKKTGIRRFFVVQGYEEVADFLRIWPRPAPLEEWRLYTGDFSTMYTTILLTDLVVRIKSVCREAWTDAAADQLGVHSDKLLLNWNRGDPDWLPGNTDVIQNIRINLPFGR